MELHNLPVIANLSDNITIVEKEKIKIVRVVHPKATAGIALFGGHVLSYQPAGQPDLLWMSETSLFDSEHPIRGGIPVCWPWFGGISSPNHGFARIQEWQLLEHRESEEGVVVSLGLKSGESTLHIWPYQFELRLHIAVGSDLKVSLEIINTDEKVWNFSGALHSYLNIGDIQKISTTGMGKEYIDKLQNNQICQGEPTLTLTEGIDRIYTAPDAQVQMADPALNRTITVENTGHNSAVLWNPWASLAQQINDMPDDGYKTMFCIESTIFSPCLSAGITLQPGEQHTLTTAISSQNC
ncbi:Putative glucose-6-phosphate 1-epimerase [Vibrio aerogenes CECT 7868]|uniref:Putative glucose-6-phosphate 1-epimerase n=1 Tax=Vibrio aerogenes CECT 7868 TaxID=1216006 RepID=A0A1M6BST3_9VIBR|nr:D-hexose-6-phosphate mutarotase [Vibrio aerogenes]SHI51839.1 Putative glucose-6-phosphate 1-epimerase [Vibrio aerogenes CECT 7868]